MLNGGAPTGDAATCARSCSRPATRTSRRRTPGPATSRPGTTLMCKPGLDREKVALSQQTALQGVKVVGVPHARPVPTATRSTASSSSAASALAAPRASRRSRSGPVAASMTVQAIASAPSITARSADALIAAAVNSGWWLTAPPVSIAMHGWIDGIASETLPMSVENVAAPSSRVRSPERVGVGAVQLGEVVVVLHVGVRRAHVGDRERRAGRERAGLEAVVDPRARAARGRRGCATAPSTCLRCARERRWSRRRRA